MARVECPREPDVATMVHTGRWPDRAPAELREHAARCGVCADLAMVVAAVDEESAERFTPRLPSSGTVWWRAQLRARQQAAREVVRPITVAQAIGFAAIVGIAGALFGATTDWFQRALQRSVGAVTRVVSSLDLPSLPSPPSDATASLANYSATLLVIGMSAAVIMAVVVWALREE